jgi:chromosome segregation protein
MRERLDSVRARVSELEVERARLLSDAEHVRRGAQSELMQSIEEVVEAAREARDVEPAPEPEPLAEEEEELAGSVLDEEITTSSDPAEAARQRIDYLRRNLDALGGVNMNAVEDLAGEEERFTFMTTQRKDVLDSIEATENALTEIKRRSRQRFREAFAEINRNFGAMFQELFGGGRGEMIMLDEEDVLESGIDIVAQPPGKRLQNVLLLSGGEKAMTAISLVLAIFKYKPSPFCLLDEVDAPLDEVNVGRFSDHIVEMSRTTQFLVITHSKRTMESARALYGVTMEEPGVSKLVSVRFAEAEYPEPPQPEGEPVEVSVE